jgi:hypothetical protein
MTSMGNILQRLATQAAEMDLRSVSNPEELALRWEREAIADMLHNQLELIKAISLIDPSILEKIRCGD